MVKNWIQKAVRHPGRVDKYMHRVYGAKAFTKKGDVKVEYIQKAIADLKARPESRRPKGLLNALELALRLKKMKRK